MLLRAFSRCKQCYKLPTDKLICVFAFLKMVSKEKLNAQFLKVGLNVESEVLDLCVEICERQKIDEASFVDAWVAFSMTGLQSSVPPSASKLIFFEKKEFGDPIFSTPKQSKASSCFAKKETYVTSPVSSKTPKRRAVAVESQSSSFPVAQVLSSSNNAGNIQQGSHSTPSRHTLSTFENTQPEELETSSAVDLFTSGQTVITYGNESEYSPTEFQPKMKLSFGDIKKTWSCMMDIVFDTLKIRKDNSLAFSKELLRLNNLPEPAPFTVLPLEKSLYVGKIVQTDGPVTTTDLVIDLLGNKPPKQSGISRVYVDISMIKNFSVFSGQIIAFRGVSRGTDRIVASDLYTNAQGPIPNPPLIPEPITIMFAAGPFDPIDEVEGEIINAVIDHAKRIQPTILIIIGPFLECLSDFYRRKLEICGDEHFKITHGRFMDRLSREFMGMKTQVFYQISNRDVTTVPVYPTPVSVRDENSHLILPDPALIDMNGLIVGVTTTDTIFYLSQQEFSNCKGNRLGRLASHLIRQQSFYPLEFGPFDELAMDYSKLSYLCQIPVTPHIMITPSKLRYFIKEVEGCVFVNPEKCVKGRRGNNYGLIEIRPKKDSEEWSVSSHISAKIVRI